jgi:hypothetical protein
MLDTFRAPEADALQGFDDLSCLHHGEFRRHGLHGDLDQLWHRDRITNGEAGFDA